MVTGIAVDMANGQEVAEQGEPLRAALLATDNGIGCHYRLRVEGRLGVGLLAGLGLVRPIRQRIPDCDEHACPLRADCRFARLFSEGAAGRSGKKYRLAPLGEGALRDATILRQVGEAARELPLARRVLAVLSETGRPLTIFALNTALLDQSLAALAEDGDPGEAAFERGELAGLLALLTNLGAIAYDGYRVALPA